MTSYGRNKNHDDEKNQEKANNSPSYRCAAIKKEDNSDTTIPPGSPNRWCELPRNNRLQRGHSMTEGNNNNKSYGSVLLSHLMPTGFTRF